MRRGNSPHPVVIDAVEVDPRTARLRLAKKVAKLALGVTALGVVAFLFLPPKRPAGVEKPAGELAAKPACAERLRHVFIDGNRVEAYEVFCERSGSSVAVLEAMPKGWRDSDEPVSVAAAEEFGPPIRLAGEPRAAAGPKAKPGRETAPRAFPQLSFPHVLVDSQQKYGP
jgi:hypothetical protein